MSETENRSEYVAHAKKATELLKQSAEVHRAEVAREVNSDEATELALDLNEQASQEIDAALESLKGDTN